MSDMDEDMRIALVAMTDRNASDDTGYILDPLSYGLNPGLSTNFSLYLNESSDTATPSRLPLLKQSLAMVVILSAAYLLVFILAVVNNSLVVSVIYRNPQMRNVTNYFLANLAVADIMVSFLVLPLTLLANLFSEWHFGPFLCKAGPYLQAVAVSASVTTQAVVALERYFAIFYPHKTIIRPNSAIVVIIVIWLIPMCVQVPWAIYCEEAVYRFQKSGITMTYCYPNFVSKTAEKAFFLGVVFLTCYLLPLCFITVCYACIGIKVWKRNVAGIRGSQAERSIQRSKIRIVRMLIVVAVFFALSWLPLYSIRMRLLFGPQTLPWEKNLHAMLTPVAQWMGSANSCVNPFIYCYFSEQFRKSILKILRSKTCLFKKSGHNMHPVSDRKVSTAVTAVS